MDSNGNFIEEKLVRDPASGTWRSQEEKTRFGQDTVLDGKEWQAGTTLTEYADDRAEAEGVSGDGKAQATFTRDEKGNLHGELYKT